MGVVLIWGTFRLQGARDFSGMRPEVVDDENQWTFGQLLPVLLLLSPIFNTFSLFLVKIHHLPPPRNIETMEMGPTDAFSNSPDEPPKDITRPLARSQISRLATMDVAPQSWTGRDYYSAAWAPSCVGSVCLACFYTPGLAAGHLFSMAYHMRPQFTLLRFWVLDFGGLWSVILGVPMSTTFCIMLGLGLQKWFESSQKRIGKQWLHFLIATCILAG